MPKPPSRVARAWSSVAAKVASLDPRDYAIIAGLVFVWLGLWNIYRPFAPLGVGGFLLWFTTIRRVSE